MDYETNIPNNLPPKTEGFVNRENELKALNDYLIHQKFRFISISGEAGMGKTSLVLQFAHSLLNQNKYRAIVWSTPKPVELISKPGLLNIFNPTVKNENVETKRIDEGTWVNSLDDLYMMISQVSGYITQQNNSITYIKQSEVLAWMRDRQILLILDDLDSWDWGDALNFVKKVPPDSAVIITTRRNVEPNYLQGVVQIDLDSLPLDMAFKLIDDAVKNVKLKINSLQKRKIFEYSGGNPLITQLITSLIIKRLEKIDLLYPLRYVGLLPQISIDKTINKIIDDIRNSSEARKFLFNDLHENLTPNQKEILFAIAFFQVHDTRKVTILRLEKVTGIQSGAIKKILQELHIFALIQLDSIEPIKVRMHNYIAEFVVNSPSKHIEEIRKKEEIREKIEHLL